VRAVLHRAAGDLPRERLSVETITLRPAEPADRAFLLEVYASTRADELARVPWTYEQRRAFVEQQFTAQDTDYRRRFTTASFDVVMLGDEGVGRLYTDRRPKEVHIIDIALLPDFRRRGIGTTLFRRLFDEAEATGKAVTIYVERFNPAIALYRRLGFVQAADDGGVYLLMSREPGAAPAAS
jgi:ribosomal protein S18 acetylase RimI-like enzyme